MKNYLLEMFIENFQKTFMEVSAVVAFFLLFVYVNAILYFLVNPPKRWEEKFNDIDSEANNNSDSSIYKIYKSWAYLILAVFKPIFYVINTFLYLMRKN
ncbi:hypothetical protein HO539_04910 [Streptococcus suis]|nr:hypothetical protein [Streptococcus suis]